MDFPDHSIYYTVEKKKKKQKTTVDRWKINWTNKQKQEET